MVYFKDSSGVIGTGTQLPPNGNYIVLTQEEYEKELKTIKIIMLTQRYNEITKELETEEDGLNIMLLQRELEDINKILNE